MGTIGGENCVPKSSKEQLDSAWLWSVFLESWFRFVLMVFFDHCIISKKSRLLADYISNQCKYLLILLFLNNNIFVLRYFCPKYYSKKPSAWVHIVFLRTQTETSMIFPQAIYARNKNLTSYVISFYTTQQISMRSYILWIIREMSLFSMFTSRVFVYVYTQGTISKITVSPLLLSQHSVRHTATLINQKST